MLNPRKLISLQDIQASLDWGEQDNHWDPLRPTVVFTNGCFDVLHPGHIVHLEAARAMGHTLVVGLNSDASVRQLKGEGRPLLNELERATMLSALESVDYVVIFDGLRCTELINAVKPDIYVKGGDYTLYIMDAGERAALEACGADIRFLPLVGNYSTSDMLRGDKNGNAAREASQK